MNNNNNNNQIKCKFLKDEKCKIASDLAEKDIITNTRACNHCSNLGTPQQINSVTVSLAITETLKENPQKSEFLLNKYKKILIVQAISSNNDKKLKAILNGKGVGSRLWFLLEKLGIKHKASCGCIVLAEKMNSWGIDGCNKNRKEIIDNMSKNAKLYGWGDIGKAVTKAIFSGLAFKLSIKDPFGSLLNEAIRLTQEKK